MRVVDVFAGCGGFSLGAEQAGFEVVAAVDIDAILTSSYAGNFPGTYILLKDAAKLKGDEVRAAAGGAIDGMIGGPPCQGFSVIGKRNPKDPRRQLVFHFFRIVREVEPSFFVMENVRGLAYSGASGVLESALGEVNDRYWILGPTIWDASEFGAATNRSRLFVVGIHKDWGEPLTAADVELRKRPAATVRAAIRDLEGAAFLGEEDGFDIWAIARVGWPFDYARGLRSRDGRFTGHRVTKHSGRVRARFEKVPAGGVDPVGRHPRLEWSGQCPAIRAGTGTDRGSYQAVRPIHPHQPRVVTVREAARLQGFPDRHRFHSTIWHSFRMIGNSVSPFVAEGILLAIRDRFQL